MKVLCVNGNMHKNEQAKINCTLCNRKIIKIKEICSKCNNPTGNLKYHNCEIDFHIYSEDAWLGDSEHRTTIIKYLKSLGYKRDCSNTILPQFVEDYRQVNYLIYYKYLEGSYKTKYNMHKLSSIFEAKFITDTSFRKQYVQRLYSGVIGGVINKLEEDYKG